MTLLDYKKHTHIKYYIGRLNLMLESAQLQLKLSELQQKLNTITDSDDYDASEMDGLTAEYNKLESRYRVALIQESEEIEATPTGDLDSEGRESRALERDIKVRHYIVAAVNDFPLEGGEREYNDAMKLTSVGTQLPWVALLSPEARAEMRDATVAPSNSDLNVRGILARRVCVLCGRLSWRFVCNGSSRGG